MDSILSEIVDILESKFALPRAGLTPDAEFESLNLDSLVLTELTVILQGRYGITLDESEVTGTRTIGELAALVGTKGVAV